MIALLVIRDGTLPAGADEAASEAGGSVVLVGSGCALAATELVGCASRIQLVECGNFAPSSWAAHLAPILAAEARIVLPASPDGRDLAPHLAYHMKRKLFAGALRVGSASIELVRWGGLQVETVVAPASFIATLQVGVRSVEHVHDKPHVSTVSLEFSHSPQMHNDATVIAVLPPDAESMDLSESPRIIGGGAGITSSETFDALYQLGKLLDASVGATRVVTDRGWAPHQRQIGTTGVIVKPEVYLAFGVSGAVQHTSGLGQPRHIVSVNTDAHCPMMQLADLGVVCDVNALVPALVNTLRQRDISRASTQNNTHDGGT